jgi:hypothetical protein
MPFDVDNRDGGIRQDASNDGIRLKVFQFHVEAAVVRLLVQGRGA